MGFFDSPLGDLAGVVVGGFYGSSGATTKGRIGKLIWAYGGAGDTPGSSNEAREWTVLKNFLNFSQGEASLDCFLHDDSLEDITRYLPNYDDNKQVMLLRLKFPHLFSKSLNSLLNWGPADDLQITAELTNFINSPWNWIPPGGLYFSVDGKLYDVTGGDFNNNIPGNVSSQGDGIKNASWNWFESFYEDNSALTLQNMEINVPLPPPYGNLDFDADTPYTVSTVPGSQFNLRSDFISSPDQEGFNQVKNIYQVFKSLATDGSTNSQSSSLLRGSVFSCGIGLNCYLSTDSSFLPISMMRDFLTLTEHRYGTPQIQNDNAANVIWRFDVNDALEQKKFVQLLNDLRDGNFTMPLNLAYLSKEGGTELQIHFDFAFYVFNGAQKFAINPAARDANDPNIQSGMVLKLGLANIGLGQVDNETTVYDIDWRVGIDGTPLSPCQTCANVYCDNGVPLINAAGTCGQLITKAYNDVSKNLFLLAQNFVNSIQTTREKMLQLQQALLDDINSIQEASTYSTVIPQSEQNAITTLKGQILGLKDSLDVLEAKIHSKLKEFHYSDGQQAFYEYLCESGSSAQAIIGLENEIEGYFASIKTFVESLQTILEGDSNFSNISFTEGKFDLSTLLNDLNSRLADVSNSLNDTQGKANDATQGISGNPNGDTDGDTSNVDNSEADGGTNAERSFPKWATYLCGAIGGLIVIVAITLLVLRFGFKTNYLKK